MTIQKFIETIRPLTAMAPETEIHLIDDIERELEITSIHIEGSVEINLDAHETQSK